MQIPPQWTLRCETRVRPTLQRVGPGGYPALTPAILSGAVGDVGREAARLGPATEAVRVSSRLPNRAARRPPQGVSQCLRSPSPISACPAPCARPSPSAASPSPFAIQRLVIGDVLAGRDVLAKSPTGSGKTLAFDGADRRPHRGDRPRARRADPRPDARARHADRRGELRRSPTPARSRSPPSTAASASRSRPARPRTSHIVVATPGRLEDLLQRGALSPRPRQDPRPRRGRPHARHGLPPAGRPHRRAVPARAPDAVLLRHARRRGRPRRQRLHARRRAATSTRRRVQQRRRRSSTASSPSSATTASTPLVERAARASASSRSSSCAPSAAPTGSSSA